MRLRRQAVSASSWVSWVSVGVAGAYSSKKWLDVALVGGGVFGGEDGGAAGQAVSESILGRTLFAGGGAGAGGEKRVRAVGASASGGDWGFGVRGWAGNRICHIDASNVVLA